MVVFSPTLRPMTEMSRHLGINLGACWNGNEELICFASAICLQCQKGKSCNPKNLDECPNHFLFDHLPRSLPH
jgi:hypothetical protein